MVKLTKIYTRTGDDGTTRLADLSEASKTDLRVEAYGQVDEANCLLGLAAAQPDLPAPIATVIAHLQNELFDAGADLATPLTENPPYPQLRVIQEYIDRLEGWCDEFGDELPALQSFILPGGGLAASWLQLTRAVIRRAERTAWRAAEEHGLGGEGGVNPLAIKYLNRLSDLLFILGRSAGQTSGEVLWVPGKDREVLDPRGRRQRERISGSEPPVEPTPAS